MRHTLNQGGNQGQEYKHITQINLRFKKPSHKSTSKNQSKTKKHKKQRTISSQVKDKNGSVNKESSIGRQMMLHDAILTNSNNQDPKC